MWRNLVPLLLVAWRLAAADYEDRVRAAWTGQIIGTLLGFPFEHKTASVVRVDQYPKPYTFAPVDDDYYYELVALRAFEKYGPGLTIEQLGAQWKENNAGTWGSSRHTRLALARGVPAAEAGHPRHNPLWFSIGPQFSADIYGMLAPGNPNLAGEIARRLCRINGYAEGADGGVFVAGMVSLAFRESDSRQVVRQAARLIHPSSPYRQCLDQVIALGEQGKTPREVFQAVEDRWHIEYPATNNAVANGGIVAASVWFGEGDYLKTVNLAFGAADFTDADCNAANAGAVAGAMRGMKGLPRHLVDALNDRISGARLGDVQLTPPVEEKISDIARRTVAVSEKILAGAKLPSAPVKTQPPELFDLASLTRYWNPDWTLERAGFGGAGGGMGGIRGNTHLDGDVLLTYPRDEVRGLLLRRKVKLAAQPVLHLEVSAAAGRAWQLEVYAGNARLLSKLIEGDVWQTIDLDLADWRGQEMELRLYQRVLGKTAGNARWRRAEIRGQ